VKGWLVKVEVKGAVDAASLLDARAYESFVADGSN
jgi:glycine cleavage system H lipoate-binding protein